MKLEKIEVEGKLGFSYSFNRINFLLGANGAGKTTFTKLLLYALGADFDKFIPEISDKQLSEKVHLTVIFSDNDKFIFSRKLPSSELIVVKDLNEDDERILSIEEFSSFLMDKNEYKNKQITYGDNKKASIRFYFLLRALYVDQETEAYKVLSNVGGKRYDYINSNDELKKEIILSILSEDTTGRQKLLLEIQELKQNRKLKNNELAAIKDLLERNHKDVYLKNVVTLKNKIREVSEKLNEVTNSAIEMDEKSIKEEDKIYIAEINNLEKKKSVLLISMQRAKLLVEERKESKKKFISELVLLNQKSVIRDYLTNIPISLCPICESKIEHNEDKCSLCGNDLPEYDNENILLYKRLLEETIIEIDRLLLSDNIEYQNTQKEYNTIIKRIKDTENRLKELNDLSIVNKNLVKAKRQIAHHSALREYLISAFKLMVLRNGLKSRIEKINDNIKELTEKLLSDDTKSKINLETKIDTIINVVESYYNEIYETKNKIEFDSLLMPLVNATTIREISSASEKVVLRLLYLLGLLSSSKSAQFNHPGFLILDSPRDKDLDFTNYEKLVKIIQEVSHGQIIMTASIDDSELFPNNVIDRLAKPVKLLRVKDET